MGCCMKILFCFWLLLAPLLASAQQTPAGRVEEVQGDARIYDPASNMRPAKIGEIVNEGDSIVTGADGEVHLAMEDEGQIALRPNTRMRIAKYKAEGGSSDTSIIALVQGALRSVTGWIGKYNPKGYAIRTPTATIGVRGTDHETMVIAKGGSDGEAGTYDKVNHGATLLSTQHGQTEVRPNQAGFVSLSGKSKPRVLSSVPTFFRPAGLDNRFQNLHEKVRQQVDTKRSQRIETIKERRQKLDEGRAVRGAEHSRQRDGERARNAEQRTQVQQERRDKAELKRQENRQRFDSGRQRMEEHQPGNAKKSSGTGQHQLHESGNKREQSGRNNPPDRRSGGGGHSGGGHPGGGRGN
ncbi:MAG: hypothetical protein QG619_668 [Pseudomonadota bacterium]|nr:hypothetical protein [Pseudomonadota bacterium]